MLLFLLALFLCNRGLNRTRTYDLYHVKVAL